MYICCLNHATNHNDKPCYMNNGIEA